VNEIEVFKIADETALPANLAKCANGRLFQEMSGNADDCLFEAVTSRGMSRGAQAGDIESGNSAYGGLFLTDDFACAESGRQPGNGDSGAGRGGAARRSGCRE
jgi:hypothetical protein